MLVPEISSPENEMHLSVHNGQFFFASDRSGGKGHYDLYSTSTNIGLDTEVAMREPIAEQPAAEEPAEQPPTVERDRGAENRSVREGDPESYSNPTANRGREEDLERAH